MTTGFRVTEKEFLIKLVVREFNFQTGSNLRPEDMVIYSIPPATGFRYGYEINLKTLGDTVRLIFYFNIGHHDTAGKYSLELMPPFMDGVLGDEVYVFKGAVDTANTMVDGFKFNWLRLNDETTPILLQTDRSGFQLVDGGFINLA